jgi:hypothetical protein
MAQNPGTGRSIYSPTIQVGQGVTHHIGSDRYPYTVAEVITPTRVEIQADDYKRTDSNGLSESQTYEYTQNRSACRIAITLRKNGRWHRVGESMNSASYSFGGRSAYQDPSF